MPAEPRRRPRWQLVASLLGGAVLLAACGDASEAPREAAPDPSGDATVPDATGPVPHDGGVALPPSSELPPTDLDERIVALESIVFNTFDGGFLRLSDASPDRIADLRDRIPPIERPRYVLPGEEALADDDLVLGYVAANGQPYAFPVAILNFHEIINDRLGDQPVLVTYCPLCRSGIVYDRRLDGQELTFGNTSALFDNDLVMYDHQTNSYWWHIAGRGLVGDLAGEELEPLASSMAAWSEWLERHPDTLVLSTETGFDRPYGRGDPFRGYQDQVDAGQRPFPRSELSQRDDRLPDGEDVLGIVLDGEARAYPLRQLGNAVVNDQLAATHLLVISRADGPSGVAYDRRVDGRALTFAEDGEALVDEQTGSRWGRDGRAVDGPLEGRQLEAIGARTSFWFAFVASFPDTEVFDVDEAR